MLQIWSTPLFTLIHTATQTSVGRENQMMLMLELTAHALSLEKQQSTDKEFVMALKQQRDKQRQKVK